MCIVKFKAMVVAAPEPPFVGTRIGIRVGEDRLFGIRIASVAEGVDEAYVHWGDGSVERIDSGADLQHEYAKGGEYEVRLSDGITQLAISSRGASSFYYLHAAPKVLSYRSDATRLESFGPTCFYGCENLRSFDHTGTALTEIGSSAFMRCAKLEGDLRFPEVRSVLGTSTALPFAGCERLSGLHFAESNKSALLACAAFANWETTHLGAPNATLTFDP